MTGAKIWKVVWDYIVLTFGVTLFCMAWTSLLIPGGISSGGVTGLSTIIYFGTHIPVSYSYAAINFTLLILGFIVMGKGFGFKTIYVMAISAILFEVLPRFDFLVLHLDDKFLTCVLGGIFEAIGIGIVLMRGGSTGGTDIVAMIINKYWPISPGKIYLYSDIVIVASVLLVPGKTVNDMIYGYLTTIIFSFGVDYVMMGNKTSVQMLIFSDYFERIANFLITDMDRGVTVLRAEGWYSKQDKNVLLVICRKSQHNKIAEKVKEIDPNAFISISSIKSVYGEGFEEIKTGLHRKKKGDEENTEEKLVGKIEEES